jgi:hypothetical protein
MHAKLAVADRWVLLVTSAGVAENIEAGLLIRGGTALLRGPSTSTLCASGDLSPLS